MSNTIRVAAVQMDPKIADPEHNLAQMEQTLQKAKSDDVDIVVFPECAVQGIVYTSFEDARTNAEPFGGRVMRRLEEFAQSFDIAVVSGFLERLPEDGGISNSAAVYFPDGSSYVYRKTHLTELGADRWATPGSCLSDILTFRGLRFGLVICYDVRFPEASRSLALRGADAILLPTNSPVKYEALYDHGARTRAWENRVWFVVANRTGTETDTAFVGRSLIVDPLGNVVASAGGDEVTTIVADLDVDAARSKLLPGHDGAQYSFWSARRPDLYGSLVATDVTDEQSVEGVESMVSSR